MGKIQKAIAAIYAEKQEMGKIRQKDLAKALGCSQATVSHIINGSRTLSEKWIESLCEQLDITLGDIEEAKSHREPKELRDCFVRLKRLYETRYVPGFRSVSRNIDDWLEEVEPVPAAVPEPESEPPVVSEAPANVVEFPKPVTLIDHDVPQPARFIKVPYYDRIPAGDPVQLAFDQSFWIDIVHSSAKPGWWTTRVWGDSMLPEYRDGDIVLMDRDQAPQNGTIVAALIDGVEATFKVFDREGDEVILTPLNRKKFKPRRFHAGRVTIQGVLVELVRRAPPQRRSLRRRK